MSNGQVVALCNQCNGAMREGYGVNTTVGGGYNSTGLLDLTRYQFALCEMCLRKVFDSFERPPTVLEQYGKVTPYAEERVWWLHNRWIQTGEQCAKFGTGLCNAREECQAGAVWRVFCSGELIDMAVCDEHLRDAAWATNFVFAPAEKLSDIPSGSAPGVQKRGAAQVFLEDGVTCDPSSQERRPLVHPEEPSYFIYIPHVVADVVGVDSAKHGGVWCPHTTEKFWRERGFAHIAFSKGTFFYGSCRDIALSVYVPPRAASAGGVGFGPEYILQRTD